MTFTRFVNHESDVMWILYTYQSLQTQGEVVAELSVNDVDKVRVVTTQTQFRRGFFETRTGGIQTGDSFYLKVRIRVIFYQISKNTSHVRSETVADHVQVVPIFFDEWSVGNTPHCSFQKLENSGGEIFD